MSTIYVEDSYTLSAGTTLDVVGETAFVLDGSGAPTLTIAGALNVTSDADDNFWGVTTKAAGLSTIVLAAGGSYHLAQTGGPWNTTVAGQFFGETKFENRGLISVQSLNHGEGLNFRAGGSLDNSGRISVTGGDNGGWGVVGADVSVDNSGVIELHASYGVAAQGMIDNTGLIYVSADAVGTAVDAMGDFHNAGRIVATTHSGHAIGVKIEAFDGVFSNEGRIVASSDGPFGGDDGIGVQLAQGTADQHLTFDNSGVINADYAFEPFYVVYGDPQITLKNSGKIVGQVALGAANDVLSNSGKIVGDVGLYGGDDIYQAVGKGKVSGVVSGGGGADLLIGGKGAEVLNGEGDTNGIAGENTLIGGGGADTLSGGSETDYFVYRQLSDSTAGNPDFIVFLRDNDIIDLSKIDADTTLAGNQAFHIVARLDGHAGEVSLNYSKADNTTRLSLDVNGDGKADAVVIVGEDHHDFTGFVF